MNSRNEILLRDIIDDTKNAGEPQSRIEEILTAIRDDVPIDIVPVSRAEALLLAIKNDGEYVEEPQSRNEAILLSILNDTPYEDEPLSTIEALLLEWKKNYGRLVTISGIPPIEFTSKGKPLASYSITGNTVQDGNPTPEQPVEVKMVGDRTDNLWKETSFDGTSGGFRDFINTKQHEIKFEENTQYTISFKHKTDSTIGLYKLCFTYSDGTESKTGWFSATNTPLPFTSALGKTVISLTIIDYNNYTKVKVEDIMLNTGSTPLPYEPYGYKIPITCGGKTETIYFPTPLAKGEVLRSDGSRDVKWIKQTVEINSLVTLDNGLIGGVTRNFDYRDSEADTSRGSFYCDRCAFSSRRIENTFYVNRWNAVFVGNLDSTLQEFKGKYDGAVLIYPIKEPTADQIDMPTLETINGTNTLTIDTEVQPDDVTITGKGIAPIGGETQ